MTPRRLAIVALLLAAAWLVAPRRAPDAEQDSVGLAVRTVTGPFRGLLVDALRLRASFARSDGRPIESIRFQEMAVAIAPDDTEAVTALAWEIAFDLPNTGATALEAMECARSAVAVVERARRQGNGDLKLIELEAFLWDLRVAPDGVATRETRLAALDRAVDLAEEIARVELRGNMIASVFLGRRGYLHASLGGWDAAANDFERAAAHERVLAQAGGPGAGDWATASDRRAALARILDAGETDPAAQREAVDALREVSPNDPLLKGR